MHHPITNVARGAASIVVVVVIAACGASGAPTSIASVGELATPVSTPAPSSSRTDPATPAPAVEPVPIEPGTVPAEEPLERLWTATGPTETRHLAHPAIDPQGRIWVLPDGLSEFWIFNRDGRFVEAWGTAGDGEGEFDFRRENDTFGSVAFAPDGSFAVAESGNHRVQVFDADRRFLLQFGEFGTDRDQLISPNLVRVDGSGSVYVHDDELGGIKMWGRDGTFVRTFAGVYPFFDVDARGHVLSVNHDLLLREYTPDGEVVRSIDLTGLVSFVSGVLVDADGHLWVGSNLDEPGVSFPDRLLEFDAEGRLIHDWEGMAIDGIAIDPAGDRLYTGFYEPNVLSAYALPGG